MAQIGHDESFDAFAFRRFERQLLAGMRTFAIERRVQMVSVFEISSHIYAARVSLVGKAKLFLALENGVHERRRPGTAVVTLATGVANGLRDFIAMRGNRVVVETPDGRVVATGDAASGIDTAAVVACPEPRKCSEQAKHGPIRALGRIMQQPPPRPLGTLNKGAASVAPYAGRSSTLDRGFE